MISKLEASLKSKYSTVLKFKAGESGVVIYFRLLTKKEYDTFMSFCDEQKTTPESEDYLLETVVIGQAHGSIDDMFPGEVSDFAVTVAAKSGFDAQDSFVAELNKERTLVTSLGDQIVCFISKAFPSYKIEEIENLNYKQLAKLLAMSEMILQQQINLGLPETQNSEEDKQGLLGNPTRARKSERELSIEAREKAIQTMKEYREGKIPAGR